jgi:serine/threonine-protein kinase
MLGRYRLIAPLAQGGMAELFLARHEGPGGFEKDVVIKRVHPHLARDPRFAAMFLDEARLAARLSHPNIVNITDLGEANGTYFLCMERLEGEDLNAILHAYGSRERTIPASIAAVITSAACDGLHFAHTLTDAKGEGLGLVHRDVSPSNIFITHQGAVKVLDFGIAKARGRAIQTESGELKGKVIYMSPEQARGEELDARSDIFALGIVLYEMLTGVRPFQRDDLMISLAAVAHGHAEPPKKLRPDLPPQLSAIVARAMHPNRDKRFHTAQEMRQALDQYLTSCTTGPAAALLQRFMAELREDEKSTPSSTPAQSQRTVNNLEPAPSDAAPEPSPRPEDPSPAARHPKPRRSRFAVGATAAGLASVGLLLWVGRTPSPAEQQPQVLVHPSLPPPLPEPPTVKPAAPAVSSPENTEPARDPKPAEPRAPTEARAPAEAPRPANEKPEAPAPETASIATPEAEAPRPTPAPPVRPARKPAVAAARGLLTVQCAPQWCQVSIDGQDKGYSPLLNVPLQPGPHRISALNPRTKAVQQRTVMVTANQSATTKFQVE